MKKPSRPAVQPSRTLWSPGPELDEVMLAYTVGDDREWDRHLLPWDVLGSLGHIEGLRASALITQRDHVKLRAGLRAAFRAVRPSAVAIGRVSTCTARAS